MLAATSAWLAATLHGLRRPLTSPLADDWSSTITAYLEQHHAARVRGDGRVFWCPPQTLHDVRRFGAFLTRKRSCSELLFPPRWGDGLMSASALDKPFKEVTAALKKERKLSKKITPRAMRRTFQDLAREAQVKDVVTRAISGHATEQMQRHYSTVNQREVEESIGKVISLSRARELLEASKAKRKKRRGGTDGGTEHETTKKNRLAGNGPN